MKTGLIFLVLAYVLSQFYRAFLAVLAPVLAAEIGAAPEDLARASGLWFLSFALMQIPIGSALDRFGPRLTASMLLGLGGGGGALLFGLAQGPGAIDAAMVLIGIGCSPVLMASYYIFARSFTPAVFGTLAGVVIGVGSLGNLASSAPLVWAAEVFGWRETVLALAALTAMVATALACFITNPPRLPPGGPQGSLLDLLRMPQLWLILPMMAASYGPAAGIRGLWIGPYLDDTYAADATTVGRATLVMGLAMVVGNFAYGPLDRILGTRKGLVLGGTLLAAACLITLWLFPAPGFRSSTALLAALGLFGASFPAIMAHGRALLPPHLTGRGVTLINLFGIGGAGLMQFASGPIHTATGPGYSTLFGFFAAITLTGCAIYAFSADRTD